MKSTVQMGKWTHKYAGKPALLKKNQQQLDF